MNHARRTSSPLESWTLLQEGLAGSFTAQARGLLGSRFSLLGGPGGEDEFAQLRMLGAFAAEVRAGESVTGIERTGVFGARYRMTTDGSVALLAGPESPKGSLRIFGGGKVYEAESSLLRNTATARLLATDGEETPGGMVRLEGGFTGRGYRATFQEGDGGALAVAVFLLYRNVALRRQAF